MDIILSIYWTDGQVALRLVLMSIVLPHLEVSVSKLVFCILLFCAPMRGCSPIFAAQTEDNSEPAHARPAPEARPGAGPPAVRETRPALLVYSQRRLSEEGWEALFTALRANLPEAAAKVPAGDADPQFLRGDDPANGDVPKAITVYLIGDCRPSVELVPFPQGKALGWVSGVEGRIVPIIHVECKEIGEAIARRTQWMNRDERKAAMSEAMARVVLHEWVHIATQSGAHGAEGITRARFGVDDLLAGDAARNGAGKNQTEALRKASSAVLPSAIPANRGY
jgi:hypothetical protein